MSGRRVDEILAIIDRALGKPPDWRPPPPPHTCWRCNAQHSRGWDALCPGCLAYMSGQTDLDPRPLNLGGYFTPTETPNDNTQTDLQRRQQRFRAFVRSLHRGLHDNQARNTPTDDGE